jgi:hypothetical protein
MPRAAKRSTKSQAEPSPMPAIPGLRASPFFGFILAFFAGNGHHYPEGSSQARSAHGRTEMTELSRS